MPDLCPSSRVCIKSTAAISHRSPRKEVRLSRSVIISRCCFCSSVLRWRMISFIKIGLVRYPSLPTSRARTLSSKEHWLVRKRKGICPQRGVCFSCSQKEKPSISGNRVSEITIWGGSISIFCKASAPLEAVVTTKPALRRLASSTCLLWASPSTSSRFGLLTNCPHQHRTLSTSKCKQPTWVSQ